MHILVCALTQFTTLVVEMEKEHVEDDPEHIRKLVSGIQLFKDKQLVRKEEDREDLINEIWGIIQFESMSKGKRVFRYGDYGDKFYIILKGEVSVHAPVKVFSKDHNENDDCKPYLKL